MARFVDAIDVPLSPAKAFAYLADFSKTREWDPGVVEAKRLDRGKLGLGSRFRVVVSFAGRRSALEYEITEYEPNTRLVLQGGDSSLTSIDEITFTPRGSGTRITYEARLELQGLARLADPLLHLAFQWIGAQAADGLRAATGAR